MCFWVSVFAITSKNIKRPAKIFFLVFRSKDTRITSKKPLQRYYKGIIHLIRMKSFPKNSHFLPPDTHMYTCV